MTPLIDAALGWLKWPMAVWLMLSIPQLLEADIALLQSSFHASFAPFWLGALVYVGLWWSVFQHRGWGTLLPTLIHELNHGLFAVLTFHRILSISATWSQGGEIQYSGPGNWLITIAPYFFPLATVLAVPLSSLLEADEAVQLGVLGGVFGFEIVAMTRQLHIQQPDLRKVGLPFVVAFLPGAVLWSFGAILSLMHAGPTSMIDFVLVQGQRHVLWLFHLLG